MVLKDKKRNITPRALRRIVLSIMFTKEEELEKISIKDFLESYATVVNTSPQVQFKYY
jgi:hypothetical protein